MNCRRLDALALALLAACSTTPHPPPTSIDPYERELPALRYEARLLTVSDPDPAPVEVDEEDFHRAMRKLLPDVPSSALPKESAQWLLSQPMAGSLLAEVEAGRVVRLTPMDENTHLDSPSAAEVQREYARVCHELSAGVDCLRLQSDGPTLTHEDVRVLALAIGLKPALQKIKHSLKEMVEPAAVLSMIVWTCVVYLTMWLLPEPVSKVLAAALTVGLGKYFKAHLLERMARGKYVENVLRDRFKQLSWNRTGVDAVDPVTGLKYELLSGTDWNMAQHGRRMAEEFFRMITF